MKILLAPDSFKGSLSAREAAEALTRGVKQVDPKAECVCIPIADGGEGTLETLVSEREMRTAYVHSPYGEKIKACYGVKNDVAVIEMARAAGLTLAPEEARNPELASTYGVGELILAALDDGCRRILLTVGGSGTNDGGCGMLVALGGRLLDVAGKPLVPSGASLAKVARIDATGLDPRLAECSFTVASDVTNPLLGECGATNVYGAQKGADAAMRERLEKGMENYALCLQSACARDVASIPACGAGGGLIAPLLAFCRVEVQSGIESVLSASDFDTALTGADAVITGEGRVDGQSCYGKAISGVATHAKAQGVPVFVAAGSLGDGWEELRTVGVTDAFSLIGEVSHLPDGERLAFCIANAASLLERLGERIAREIFSDC